jgi:uncharacterized protein YndB with AHSA1/START domain
MTTNKVTLSLDPEKPILVIQRIFDAPRHVVFEAVTKPEHVRNWYGPSTMKMLVCEIDFRVGGKWRYVLEAPDGSVHGFSGMINEIVPNERVVQTEGYEALPPGHDYVAEMTLTERDGKTLMTNTLHYRTMEDRAGHIASGMEGGMSETLDRLDTLAKHLATEQSTMRSGQININ